MREELVSPLRQKMTTSLRASRSGLPDLVTREETLEQEEFDKHYQPIQVTDTGQIIRPGEPGYTPPESNIGQGTICSRSRSRSRPSTAENRPPTYSELVQRSESLANEVASLTAELTKSREYLAYQRDSFAVRERELRATIAKLEDKVAGENRVGAHPEIAELGHLRRSIRAQIEAMHHRKRQELAAKEAQTKSEFLMKICQLESNLAELRDENGTLKAENADKGLSRELLAELLFLRQECKRLSTVLDAKEDALFNLRTARELDSEELTALRIQLAISQRDYANLCRKVELAQEIQRVSAQFSDVSALDEAVTNALASSVPGPARPLTSGAPPRPSSVSRVDAINRVLHRLAVENHYGPEGGTIKPNMASDTRPVTAKLHKEPEGDIRARMFKRRDQIQQLEDENRQLKVALRAAMMHARHAREDRLRLATTPAPIRTLVAGCFKDVEHEINELSQNRIPEGYEKSINIDGRHTFQGLNPRDRDAFLLKLYSQRDLLRMASQALLVEESMLLAGKARAKEVFADTRVRNASQFSLDPATMK